jgi:hypothetical protein
MHQNLRIEALGRELQEKRDRIRQINLSAAPMLQRTLFSHPELQEDVYDSLEAVRTTMREFNEKFSDRTLRQTTDAYMLETIGYQLDSLTFVTFDMICMQLEKEPGESAGLVQLMKEMIEFGGKVSPEMRNAVFLSILRNAAVPAKLKNEATKALQELHALGPTTDEFGRYFEKENDLLRERQDDEKDGRYTTNKQTNKKLIELSTLIQTIDQVGTIQKGPPKSNAAQL